MSTLPSPELHAFLQSRRSVRRFRPDPVPADMMRRILRSAIWAPSAHNRQPWRFVVLESQEVRARLSKAMGDRFRAALSQEGLPPSEIAAQVRRSQERLMEAPAAILLCMETDGMPQYLDENRNRGEWVMAVQSVALAGGILLLAAHAEGLGGVWVCAPLFTPQEVRNALELPPSWEAQAMLLLGYPAALPASRPRLPLEAVVRWI